ncbi:MAG TPA: hypothetical protein VF721_21230 [Pyrinomonadaceae bacterium]|jgi:hypothetical protein
MKPAFSQRIIASVLVIWLSGVVLLFCCENMKAQMSEADSCPLAKTSHCDKQSSVADNPEAARFQKESHAFDCCGFLPKVFDKARKIEKNPQASIQATTAKIAAPKFSFVADTIKAPKVYRPPVHNRGGTYLKNCVFRI